MERVFINGDGEMQVFGVGGDLLFEVDDVDLLSGAELEMLSTMLPEEGEAPVQINRDNIVEWRLKFKKIRDKEKARAWDN
ncbi:MAG: hypothetical protein ACO3CH_00495 [Ilumatobacteraceae bacterium]